MPVPQVGDAYVPSVGPLDAKVMIVGEAPGKDEEVAGEPFVGKSGQFLERYLNRCGIKRKEVYLTNVCKFRPKGNKFEQLLGTKELQDGILELEHEIQRMPNLNLITSVGNWPMYYTTGCTAEKGKAGTGITSWRGSVVNGTGPALGKKVLITYHPAFIIRPQGFGNHPIFLNDLRRIKQEWDFPELIYPKFDIYIDPPNLEELAREMMQSEWLTVDIETFGKELACVGFADSVKRGLCITCNNEHGWDIARMMLAGPQKKIFQFGAFDINYLFWFYGWEVVNYAYDTYIAAANLMPEFPRGLDFLVSMYTPFPFYKEERKTWKNTGNLQILWTYNIKDVIGTHWTAMEQMGELKELYGS